jgi:hypothetical protein|tara:strand:+ start:10111 stop:10416 length:306 start_codon:yes stop_codon:yes gene_type:complete
MTKTKKTKTKIKIQGKNYMVHPEVEDSIKFLSEIIRAHEVALLTWVHKIWNKQAFDDKDIKDFEKSMYEYTMRIPNANDILANMMNIDKQKQDIEEELKDE